MINKITSIDKSCNCIPKIFDEEHLRIMRQLQKYGITPTGNKTTDKMLLRSRELQEAKKENCVTNKFLTVSVSEQEKIQAEKKENKVDDNPEKDMDLAAAQHLLGEQIYLTIKIQDN